MVQFVCPTEYSLSQNLDHAYQFIKKYKKQLATI